MRTIRVASWNLQGAGQVDAIVEVLDNARVDMVGLQEVDRWAPRSGGTDCIRHIAAALGLAWFYSPSIAWFSDANGVTRQYGNAILTRLAIRCCEAYPLSHSIRNTKSPSEEPRVALLCRATLEGGRDIEFLTLHLAVGRGERAIARRATQAGRITELLRQRTFGANPWIIGGDFNESRHGQSVQRLMREWDGAPSAEANTYPVRAHGCASEERDLLIISRHWTAGAHGSVAQASASDHALVWQDLSLD